MSIDFLESVSMAGRTLSANKLRSGLTMLGIIIGNASVIAMVSVGQGAQRFVNQQFQSLGTNLLFVVPGVERGSQAGAIAPNSLVLSNSLVLADAQAIKEQVPSVLEVAPEKTDSFWVTWGSQDTQVTVTGTTPEYTSVRNSAVAQGQFLVTWMCSATTESQSWEPKLLARCLAIEPPLGRKFASGT